MNHQFTHHLQSQLTHIRGTGTYKQERLLSTPQGTTVQTNTGSPVLNMCANNYLGLAQHPRIRKAAHDALDHWGYGLASVRFICGTQEVHKKLESRISKFIQTEDTILYSHAAYF